LEHVRDAVFFLGNHGRVREFSPVSPVSGKNLGAMPWVAFDAVYGAPSADG
jgi:hypothetical protein